MGEEFDALDAAQNDVQTETEQNAETTDTPNEGAQAQNAQEEGGQEVQKPEGDNEQRWVPLPHLLRERESRQEYESRVKSLEDEISQLKGKIDQVPDYDEDPRAYLDHRLNRLEETLKGSNQITDKDVEKRVENMMFQNALGADIQATRGKHKDYDNALNHVRSVMVNQHLLSGLPEKEAWDAVINGELEMSKALMAQGQSPSEAIYNYAKQVGYKGQQPKQPESDDKISKIEQGQKASTPTGGGDAPTAAPDGDVDLFDQAMAEAFDFLKK